MKQGPRSASRSPTGGADAARAFARLLPPPSFHRLHGAPCPSRWASAGASAIVVRVLPANGEVRRGFLNRVHRFVFELPLRGGGLEGFDETRYCLSLVEGSLVAVSPVGRSEQRLAAPTVWTMGFGDPWTFGPIRELFSRSALRGCYV